ncbi:hypothetical protein PTSG_00443 [Salpingoeca rosetta]|uniref:FYVE-type domain-containing protein n=1 Tax=Salpingoeca rosetta (strain ATCC 50818 / BSB-021) TaxID=946362 RepID=F2TWH8_SALR5|nr:uncharacterized protein PTSG_00443 [Salpingoeca rosetta]EGD72424.1 hypothetical protein PTSG_00443 [Salpingoeca rosetta]|eukprot:XP_004998993.1 hypothetical protein PTSG_00443 [Salpingoeca rosetta]
MMMSHERRRRGRRTTTSNSGDGGEDEDEFEVIDAAEAGRLGDGCHEGTEGTAQTITKVHWQAPTDTDKCRACGAGFDLIDRRHWCRRCGHIHCKRCMRQQRKLDIRARPDPISGTHQPVCFQCYLEEPEQGVGPVTDHTTRFQQLRQRHLKRRDEHIRRAATNLCRACTEASPAMSTLSTALGYDPSWTKVNFCAAAVAKNARGCPGCSREFGLLLRKHHCRLCGQIFCDKCLFRSVEVFKTEDGKVKVDVLHPEYERNNSMTLLGCERCLYLLEVATKLDKRLEHSVSRSLSNGDTVKPETLARVKTIPPSPAFEKIIQMYPELMQLRNRITTALARFQEDTHLLATGKGIAGASGITKTISKHHSDLDKLFQNLLVTLQKLKRVAGRRMRPVEAKITKGVVSNMLSAYTAHIGTYRRNRAVVAEFLPDEVLVAIRVAVDFEAVKNTLILLRQLALESVIFPALEPLAMQFSPLLDTLQGRVTTLHTQTYANSGPSIEDTLSTIEALIKELIKERPLLGHLASQPDWPLRALPAWDTTFDQVLSSLDTRASLEESDTLRGELTALRDEGRRLLLALGHRVSRQASLSDVDDSWVVI